MKLAAFALVLLSASSVAAQPQQRISIADPHTAYLVEGRVVLANGRAAAGVQVERANNEAGTALYSSGVPPITTDANGRFRFHFSGLGMGSGRTWHLAVRRPGCPVTVSTVTLEHGPMPDSSWEGDVRTGIVITLPACTPSAAPPVTPPPASSGATVAIRWSGARPARAQLYVVWLDEDATPPFEFVPLESAGGGRVRLPTSPPDRMQGDDDGIVTGYVMAFRDLDRSGAPTIQQAKKIWRWREYAGVNNQFVFFFARRVTTGRRAPGLDPGMHLRSVTLTAECRGDSCRGHDPTAEALTPPAVLVLRPGGTGPNRLPNVE